MGRKRRKRKRNPQVVGWDSELPNRRYGGGRPRVPFYVLSCGHRIRVSKSMRYNTRTRYPCPKGCTE